MLLRKRGSSKRIRMSCPGFDGHFYWGHGIHIMRCLTRQLQCLTPKFKRQALQLVTGATVPGGGCPRMGNPRNRLPKWQKEIAVHGGTFCGS